MNNQRLRKLAGIPEKEQLDEAVLGGLLGLAAGSVIVWLVGELSARKQDRAFDKELAPLGVKKDRPALPIAAATAQKIKAAVQKKLRDRKLANQLEKLESDPEVKALLSTSISGRSFKKGKRKELIALLKKKTNPKVVTDLEKIANEVREELVKRG